MAQNPAMWSDPFDEAVSDLLDRMEAAGTLAVWVRKHCWEDAVEELNDAAIDLLAERGLDPNGRPFEPAEDEQERPLLELIGGPPW